MAGALNRLRKAIKGGSAYTARPEDLDRKNPAGHQEAAPRRDYSQAEAKFKEYQNMQAKQHEQYEAESRERQRAKLAAEGYKKRN